ncbi:MAG TPA: histidine kinase, partial [Burkholderiales bacterium]|nr:histidine kinase [Burkholderiales bacterium]
WVDVAVYGALAMLTAGVSHMFLLLFFFPILVASFSRGFAEGFAVTAVSAVLAGAVSLAGAAAQPGLDVFEALTRPVQILAIGTIMAYWGGRELAHLKRVELMRDVASLVNPRLGLDHAIWHSLRRLREFFEADDCILVCPRDVSREYAMFRVDEDAGRSPRPPRPLTEESTQALLALGPDAALAWQAKRTRDAAADERLRRLANLLDTRCFATVPFPQREGLAGRLYLAGGRCPAAGAQLEFLRQVVTQIAAAVDSLALIEQVMQNAAKLERARISRDIHDTTLQPYIGLKLGLEALARKLPPASPVAGQLAELLAMSTQVITDLRGYVARLRGDDAAWPGEHLLSGLREHVGRYRSFYGIEVELRSDAAMRVTDRVAGEAYQIVCEALSNIHRHTPAKRAFIDLRCRDEHLAIEVGNECPPGDSPAFMPRSIAERAMALGGQAEVQLQRRGHDVVRVAIPL